MDLRIPSGRGALLASLWAGDDEVGDGRFLDEDSAEIVPDVSPRQVVDALGLLVDGRVEYVGVNGEEGWIQTAEVPGGYGFERSVHDDEVVAYPTPLSPEQVQDAFLRFLAGDLDAGLDWSVTPADVESTPKRGWFRR